MKPLFQRQCEALVKTLTKAKADEDHILDMNTWVDEHTCGTAACVCGYQALSSDLSLFKGAMECDAYSGNDNYDYSYIASAISDDLELSCEELFGNDGLACSIYMASATNRRIHAFDAEVADEETLKTFKHLTLSKSTLTDAIEYINFIIQKCKEKAA